MSETRKTTRKSTPKSKATTRRAKTDPIEKSQANKYLARVPEEQVFWCHDGRILRDMQDLRENLAVMSDEIFSYHSSEIKKDFSNWIKDVVGDDELAKDLEKAKSRNQALKVVDKRCSLLHNVTSS